MADLNAGLLARRNGFKSGCSSMLPIGTSKQWRLSRTLLDRSDVLPAAHHAVKSYGLSILSKKTPIEPLRRLHMPNSHHAENTFTSLQAQTANPSRRYVY